MLTRSGVLAPYYNVLVLPPGLVWLGAFPDSPTYGIVYGVAESKVNDIVGSLLQLSINYRVFWR